MITHDWNSALYVGKWLMLLALAFILAIMLLHGEAVYGEVAKLLGRCDPPC